MWLLTLTRLLGNHMLNFGMVGALIKFWKLKRIPVGVTIISPNPLTLPHVVNNFHPVTWSPYVQISA